jgi:hypothetical protein
LRTFVEVVRRGVFTEASKVVFTTQSTVSKSVKQLEDEFGVRLLDRLGTRTTPTAAGEVVFRRAMEMLAIPALRFFKRMTISFRTSDHRLSGCVAPPSHPSPVHRAAP